MAMNAETSQIQTNNFVIFIDTFKSKKQKREVGEGELVKCHKNREKK